MYFAYLKKKMYLRFWIWYYSYPDYSQRSETSSCSAPPNYGAATAEDRDTGSAHSSPAATAFTIAFETEASTPRKKLGIRDSISKFAPTKSDAENRVSFQKNNKTEPSPKKVSDFGPFLLFLYLYLRNVWIEKIWWKW